MKNKQIQKLLFAIGIGIAVAILGTALTMLNPLEAFHLKIADSLYTKNEPDSNIVIIAIDDASVSDDEVNSLGRYWDWSRTYHKTVLDKLEKAGAEVVAFDLTFGEESNKVNRETIDEFIQNPDGIANYSTFNDHPDDLAFADSLQKYKNVILAGLTTEMPLAIFAPDQSKVGFVNLNPDSDGIVRKVPLAGSFDLKIAKQFSPSTVNELEVPTDEKGEMMINYFADPYKYNYISYRDIYFGDPPDLTGKIALIGVTTPKVQDHISTPKDPKTPMPGVEIHANAIQTILSGDFLQNQSKVYQIITIALTALLLALLLAYLNIWIGTALAVLAFTGYYGYAILSYSKGIIPNMIYPFIVIALTYFAILAYKYLTELREKRAVKGVFGRYVNQNVMNEILKNPDLVRLGGTNRNVTVFFSDIANFTSVSEGLSPQALVELINEYLSAMTEIILAEGGTLDKFVGDAIVAYFGAPLGQPDHAVRACNVALKMREKLSSLHSKWKTEGKPLVDFRIGINTGFVVVGNVGSEKRLNYTVMGDEVNLGSRLEGANKKYGSKIMISEATLKSPSDRGSLSDLFSTRELDLLRVKGKNKPVRVYELLARKGKLSDLGQQLIDKYNKGISLYKERKFSDALAAFNEALAFYPDDAPSKLYAERCDILSKFPPADNWDGVFTMHEK